VRRAQPARGRGAARTAAGLRPGLPSALPSRRRIGPVEPGGRLRWAARPAAALARKAAVGRAESVR
jgi:hypothetical protein